MTLTQVTIQMKLLKRQMLTYKHFVIGNSTFSF